MEETSPAVMADQSRSLTRSISCRKYERRGKQKRLHSFRTLVFYILGLELLNLQADQLSPEGCSSWLLDLMQKEKPSSDSYTSKCFKTFMQNTFSRDNVLLMPAKLHAQTRHLKRRSSLQHDFFPPQNAQIQP